MNGFQFCLEYHSKKFNTTVAEKGLHLSFGREKYVLHLERVRLLNNNRHNKFEKSWNRVLTFLNGKKIISSV